MYGTLYGGDTGKEGENTSAIETDLVLNEIAAKGEPLDWFELYNPTNTAISLDQYVVADDLVDESKRVPSA